MAVCVLIVVRTGGVCEECVEARLTSGQEPRTTLELWSALVSQNYSHTQTTPHLTSLHAVSPTTNIQNNNNTINCNIKIYADKCNESFFSEPNAD